MITGEIAELEAQNVMLASHTALQTCYCIPSQDSREPRFKPFIAESEERKALLAFKHEVTTKRGLLSMRPIQEAWIPESTELLTDAFAESMGYRPAFRRYLVKEIKGYLHKHLNLPPKAIVIMGLLQQPADAAAASSVASSSSAGELSFSASTRTQQLLLNPPRECAYLCNMAVTPDWRRQGYGMQLLRAAEMVAQLAGKQEIYLHVRHNDAPATGLYERGGYSIVKSDPKFFGWFGIDPKHLLKKDLSPFS
ncbi:hypothetical protein WJX84_006775 [Apatococcus fuscideae]|uniref:N-acetyltransferase domain-containing protein n=1 Tax=Apatococcus fuscideae TaxID=2026836 RepID=A0AAW1SL55_9CHLO